MAFPIRMCVICRERQQQRSLIRFRRESDRVEFFAGTGRSFYICRKCVKEPKTLQSLPKRLRCAKLDLSAVLSAFEGV
ncbi:MAG: DUF448 domain-containing protein [Helicobacteraceae bacterium]|nr:DUF448 domain-containing protein [Helicobacteraceae bacterium]